jgi:ketosteroid isomerase-like protein
MRRSAAADFFRDVRRLIEPLRFEIHDVLTNDSRAVIVGELASRVKSTGKTVETAFAFVLTVSGGEITRFRMLEDSFAVSQAARA